MTHCQREFFHAQWRELLNDEFLEAYEHGIVIKCCDGITRRFYPRIFAYSADYPEKFVPNRLSDLILKDVPSRILLSSIRNMGNCPCPRCLIPKDRAHLLGTKRDKSQRISIARVDNQCYRAKISSARDLIYIKNRAVDSVPVQRFLKQQSLVPTEVGTFLLSSSSAFFERSLIFRRTHFQRNYRILDSIYLLYFWWILCMSSSLESGRSYSYTF